VLVEFLNLLSLGAMDIPRFVGGADVSEEFKLLYLRDGVGSWGRIGAHKGLL
jgi:hypothetical protein